MITGSFKERSMCDYTSTYLNLKDNSYVSYSCPHAADGQPAQSDEKLCIFHDPREDKDAERFYLEFADLYRSGRHVFCGFVFPDGFDFTRLKREAGPLTFTDAVFSDAVFHCPVDLAGTVFTGESGVNFIEASFTSDTSVSLSGARFEGMGGANFRMVRFSGGGTANLSRSVFSGGAVDFTWAKFLAEGGVDFKLSEFTGNGAVDFHFAEFTGKVANFTGCCFGKEGGANFSLIQFAGGDGANFSSTKFTGGGQANFSTTNFSGRGGANFNKTQFLCGGGANFSLAQLTGKSKANFVDARFVCDGQVNFSRARFSGGSGADFSNAEFHCPAGVSFSGSTFSGEGRILFSGRTFHHGTPVDFQDVSFEFPDRITFSEVDLSHARFLSTDVTRVNFTRNSWCGRRYNSSLFSGRVKVYDELFQERGRMLRHIQRFSRTMGVGTRLLAAVQKARFLDRLGAPGRTARLSLLSRARIWAAPKEENHWGVYRLYNQLMANYTHNYRYHEAGDFFAGQMEMRRRENFENPLVRMGLWLYRLFSLFGERPAYALGWLIVVVALSGLINLRIGITGANTDLRPMAVEETTTLSPAPEPIPEPGEMIRYGSISAGDFASPTFREDYLRAVSVPLGLFIPGGRKGVSTIADSVYAPFVTLAELASFLLFSVLAVAGMWRKFGKKRSQ
jgi:hypothetical protein